MNCSNVLLISDLPHSDFITTSSQPETTCQRSAEKSGKESMSDRCSSKNNYGDEKLHLCEEETLWSFNKQCKVVKKDLLRDVELQDVEKIPYDIDGLSAYRLVSPNRNLLLQQVRDGRPWKKDSSTKWSDYEKVRFKNCGGGLKCPNISCSFLKQYGYKNRLKFDKEKCCIICGAMGIVIICEPRKYIAFIGKEAHISHVGYHTRMAKRTDIRPTELVCESIAVDSSIAPSKIQGSSILSAIRKRKSWIEIGKVVEKVTDKKAITNEKLKQKRIIQPYRNKFKAIEEYKQYANQKDSF